MHPRTPLRIGILGAASIAREFALALAASAAVTVTAVASRDPARARRFASECGLAYALDSYESLLADPGIDAIYLPLPNALHAPWAIRSLEAGKHVLCEKPLATTAQEARAMFRAARRAQRILVEGFPYRSQPHYARLCQLIEGGAIGELRSIQAAFGFTVPEGRDIRYDASLGGGALLDAGTYPVSLVRGLAGAPPLRVQATARWHPSGVEHTLAATLEHADGLLAQISCSFSTGVHRQALIAGTGGVLETSFLNNPPADRPAVLRLKRGNSWQATYETIEVPSGNGFVLEAESFARLVRGERAGWSGASEAESIDIMATLEAILRSAREGHAAELAAVAD